ncbi:hypothetical protein TWF225_003453 [Orbilia oligospora]|nr:hypothetical protein TWF225_003453 [Orbilia oligospora]KAF3250112.1 hypothetical protein TWF128_007677 [Orbilia oligospora]
MYAIRPSASSILPKCSILASSCHSLLLFPITDRSHVTRLEPHHKPQSRFYATNAHHSWPTKPISQLTPYEIFNQPHLSIYHKVHFYQLVKLYHPDCIPPSDHPCSLLSKTTRTERFRLIVAANTLLSDPAKKKAYDDFGVGWNTVPRHTDFRRRTAATYASGPWKNSPAGNATWEDWERWYKAEGMGGGGGNYYSSPGGGTSAGEHASAAEPITAHKNFVTIIMLLSFTGILIQLSRVDQFNTSYEEKRDRKNRDIQRDLWRIRRDDMGKDGRVQAFLKMRDPEGYGGVEAVREERMKRLLPEGEVCLSDGIEGGAK